MTNPIIQPADRVSQIKEYYFSRKLKEVAALNAQGKDIVSLGIGGPDLPPEQAVIDTLCDTARQPSAHSYQPFTGLPELRREYAAWYKRRYGVILDPDKEIQPLIGSKEAILHLSLTFLNPGDGVLVPNPGYLTYTSASRLALADIHTYDLKPENGWYPDFDELEKMPLDNIKLMWVNYPHMPTGAPATRELFERLVDFARRHSILIAHDNPYSFILNDNPISILSIDGARDVAVEMNSLSKSHNMAGWRMAMLAAREDYLSWFIKVKSNVDSGQFKPAMTAAIQALKADDDWYAGINRTYSSRRRIAEEIMTAMGCTFDPAQRGLFLWGRLPEHVESAEDFADDILYNARVFITPGFIFGSNGERYVRLSLCATEDKLAEALDRIRTHFANK